MSVSVLHRLGSAFSTAAVAAGLAACGGGEPTPEAHATTHQTTTPDLSQRAAPAAIAAAAPVPTAPVPTTSSSTGSTAPTAPTPAPAPAPVPSPTPAPTPPVGSAGFPTVACLTAVPPNCSAPGAVRMSGTGTLTMRQGVNVLGTATVPYLSCKYNGTVQDTSVRFVPGGLCPSGTVQLLRFPNPYGTAVGTLTAPVPPAQ